MITFQKISGECLKQYHGEDDKPVTSTCNYNDKSGEPKYT